MNNYLYANLATGKIGRSQTGGGKPIFTIGESNKTQIYFLDYPNPNYPSQALNDGFAFYPQPISQSQILTLKVGQAIGQEIISDNTWSNLPENVSFNISKNGNLIYINTSPTAITGGITINATLGYEVGFPPTSFSQSDSFRYFANTPISQLKYGLDNVAKVFLLGDQALSISSISQLDDYNIVYIYEVSGSVTSGTTILSSGITTSNNTLSGPSGKYGTLDFTSPLWENIIGNNNEAEIWIDVMLGSSTVAQGAAILRKRLTS